MKKSWGLPRLLCGDHGDMHQPSGLYSKKCPITVNPISVRVKTNYEFEDGLGSW